MTRAIAFAASCLVLASCSSQSQETSDLEATDYLRIQISEIGEPDSCMIEMTSSIAQASNLYMLNFDRYVNGQKQMLSQIKFTGHDQIDYVRSISESGVFEGAPCNTYAVSWRNLECIDLDRNETACPEIRFEADGVFGSLEARQ